jgi:lipoyl(octanoyl) transferase
LAPSSISNLRSQISNVLSLFVDPPQDGVTNMAIDGCLLAQAQRGSFAAMRLYRWAPATLSLGYYQRYDDPARLAPNLVNLPVVRRCTGGGAIVHSDELTYSLALPSDHPFAGRAAEDLYNWMHARIAEAVAALGGTAAPKGGAGETARGGPFLCFRRHARFDLMANEAKLAGSAQRRTKAAVLQHGSVVLRRTHLAQPSAALDEVLGRRISFEELADAIITAVRNSGVKLGLAAATTVDPEQFQAQQRLHAGHEWLHRR